MRADALVTVLALAGSTLVLAADKPTISCTVTQPIEAKPPNDPNADAFGNGPWYINSDRTIWAGWDAPRMREGWNKILWIRPEGTELRVSGSRLDAEAPPLTARIPCCYPTGFQASGLTFPSAGCWEIKATAGSSELTFVTEVKTRLLPEEAAEQPFAPDERAPSPTPPARS
jgi:hypothetical protein